MNAGGEATHRVLVEHSGDDREARVQPLAGQRLDRLSTRAAGRNSRAFRIGFRKGCSSRFGSAMTVGSSSPVAAASNSSGGASRLAGAARSRAGMIGAPRVTHRSLRRPSLPPRRRPEARRSSRPGRSRCGRGTTCASRRSARSRVARARSGTRNRRERAPRGWRRTHPSSAYTRPGGHRGRGPPDPWPRLRPSRAAAAHRRE